MTKHGELVVAGFTELSDTDRKEVMDEINRFLKEDGTAQKALGEWFEKRARGRILSGPVSPANCPCCGH